MNEMIQNNVQRGRNNEQMGIPSKRVGGNTYGYNFHEPIVSSASLSNQKLILGRTGIPTCQTNLKPPLLFIKEGVGE